MDTPIVLQSQSSTKPIYIYALIDPFTDLIRYVGKSENVGQRLSAHAAEARRGKKDHKNRWVASLLNRNALPIVKILEVCGEDWKERETWWIKKLREDGCNLTNSKLGGDGSEPTEESRRKMSLAKKGKSFFDGRKHSDESRLKQSNAAKARLARMTPEELAKATAAMISAPKRSSKGRKNTPEHKEKLRLANLGNQYTAKLNNYDVAEIFRLAKLEGVKQVEIAKRFNVSSATICEILKGKRYAENGRR